MYDGRLGRRWNTDPKPQIGISEYTTFNNNPIYFNDGNGDLVTVHVSNKAVGYTKINLFSATEVKKGYKQIKVKVPIYEVTVTNESGKTSTFLYTRFNMRANVKNNSAVEDRTFDVNTNGDNFEGVIKSRWNGKNNVLEIRALGRKNPEDQTGVIGMKGNESNIERVAIQFHVLGASDGCLLAVGKNNILDGSSATSSYENSKLAQAGFMSTIQAYKTEDKKNGFSELINVNFDRLHDNPNYKFDVTGESPPPNATEWRIPMRAPASSGALDYIVNKVVSTDFLKKYIKEK